MTDDAVAAWRAIRRLAHDAETLARLRRRADEHGITPSVAKALVHLADGPPHAMRDLAEALRCDTSYVTTVVDSLEDGGLAERHPHPTDRRVKVVTLTPAGDQMAREVATMLDEPPSSFARLTASEQHELARLLAKLTDEGPASG